MTTNTIRPITQEEFNSLFGGIDEYRQIDEEMRVAILNADTWMEKNGSNPVDNTLLQKMIKNAEEFEKENIPAK